MTADSHPDLFWALCGGGGNFGVATTFTYRLHPLETVIGGLIAHPIDDARATCSGSTATPLADCPDDLTVFAGLVYAPDGSGMQLAAMVVCHTGDPEEAERDLAPFKEWGSPAMVEVGPMPYPVMNTLLDDGPGSGALNYWLSSFTSGLSDGADRHRRRALRVGAVADAFGDPARALPRRRDADRRDRHGGAAPSRGLELPAYPPYGRIQRRPKRTSRGRKDTYAALAEHLAGRRWLNYLGDDQGDDAIRAAYGPNYDRLVEVKRKYDPDNVFHHNHNIKP